MSYLLSLDYLVSRAEAALDSVTKMQAGHYHYVKNMEGVFALFTYLLSFFLFQKCILYISFVQFCCNQHYT